MRHLRSILYALVLAPAVWVLCAAGLTRPQSAGWLLAAGALSAFLLVAPISPAGPALAGLVFLATSLVALIAPATWPDGDLYRPAPALAALLAVPLLATALNAQRWSRHVPFTLPFTGTPAGPPSYPPTPVAAGDEPPTVFPAQPGPYFTPSPAQPFAPPHAVPHSPTRPAPSSPGPSPAPAAERAPSTSAVTKVRPFIQPDKSDETTVATDTSEPTVAVTGDEPTQGPSPRVFVTDRAGIAEEHPAEEVTASHTDPALTGDEPTVAEADVPTAGTVATPTHPDGEKTQVIRLPRDREVGAGPTRDFRGGGKTYLDGPGEQTQVIYLLEPANAEHAAQQAAKARAAEQEARDKAAQERARQAFKDRAALERSRKAFAERAAAEARNHGEETQIIKLPVRRAAQDEPAGEPTTLLARDTGDQRTTILPRQGVGEEPTGDAGETTALTTPTEPGGDENTTLLRHASVMAEPVDGVAGEGRSRSIVEQERPDPAVDPTTRLIPARRPAEHEREHETRPRSLMDMERPADENDR